MKLRGYYQEGRPRDLDVVRAQWFTTGDSSCLASVGVLELEDGAVHTASVLRGQPTEHRHHIGDRMTVSFPEAVNELRSALGDLATFEMAPYLKR